MILHPQHRTMEQTMTHQTSWTRLRRAYAEKRLQPCALCGQDIDYDAPINTAQAFELDHIIPRSERPDLLLDPGNLQPTHSICNRRKGNKNPPLPLGARTRNW